MSRDTEAAGLPIISNRSLVAFRLMWSRVSRYHIRLCMSIRHYHVYQSASVYHHLPSSQATYNRFWTAPLPRGTIVRAP